MYGHQPYLMASILPVSLGTLLTVGWVLMAAITVLFVAASMVQLVRPTSAVKP